MSVRESLQKAVEEAEGKLEQARIFHGGAERTLCEALSAVQQFEEEVSRLNAAMAALDGAVAAAPPVPEEPKPPKPPKPEGPYAHVQCGGCGKKGTMILVKAGAPALLTCSNCNNQALV